MNQVKEYQGDAMEETVIVIMIKDPETGFLDRELGSYTVEKHEELIYNTYAAETDGGLKVYMKLTCPEDVSDWQFNAIYDYYDPETIMPYVTSIEEDEDSYNPTWTVSFDFIDDPYAMEEKIAAILSAHKREIDSVYAAIADKKDDYTDYE